MLSGILSCSFLEKMLFLSPPTCNHHNCCIGTVASIVIFVVKPQTPIFSVQTLSLDAYKLDVFSNSTLFVSSVVSLNLNAQNPNKVGLRYSRSRLRILSDGIVNGLIRVPQFYQPPHSSNISVATRVLFECVNVSQIASAISLSSQDIDDTDHSIGKMRVSGDIKAYVRLFHLTLPKVKVALDCDINVDSSHLTFGAAMHTIEAAKAQIREILQQLLNCISHLHQRVLIRNKPMPVWHLTP